MTRRLLYVLAVAIVSGQSLLAAAPASSPRPELRDAEYDSGERAIPQAAGAPSLSPRPDVRPENLKRKATVRAAGFQPAPKPKSLFNRNPRLCGSRLFEGDNAPVIQARLPGCGLKGGVRITSADGVQLSQPSLMDCQTAHALAYWIRNGLKPAVGRLGGGVAQIKVSGHYVCRTRNHKRGAKISEHGKGKAIDISGFVLKNGAQISVLTGWKDPKQGQVLRNMHAEACGPFGTVLGPNSDRHHRDHFHFDTARHGSGPYCR